MLLRRLLGVLVACLALSACGGGGGGGGSTVVPPGGSGPVSPTSPPTGAIGDVHGVAAFSATPAIAYDDDDRVLLVAQGRSFVTATGPTAITLPASDPNQYVTAAVYSQTAHALYFASGTTVYRTALSGPVTTAGSGFGSISGIAVDPSGTVYVVDGDHVSTVAGGSARALTPPGTVNTNAPGITPGAPQLAFDTRDGALYLTDPFDTSIKRVTTSGTVTVVAGSCARYSGGGAQSCWPGMRQGSAAVARFGSPSGIAYDPAADLFYVSDAEDNVLWTVTPAGTSTIVAGYGASGSFDGNGRRALLFGAVSVALSTTGQLYVDQVDPFAGRSLVSSYGTTGTAAPAYTFPALEFPTPTTPSQPQGLAGGPDGGAWFTESYGGKMGHVTAAGISEFTVPGETSPYQIAVDASNTAWATAYVWPAGGIPGAAVIRVAADGTSAAYPFTPPGALSPQIDSITIGADGNPWFNYFAFGSPSISSIKSIDRTTGASTDHPVATGRVRDLSLGPDGNIWFYSYTSFNEVDRMAPDGHIVGQPFTISHPANQMAPNPVDHAMWYVDAAVTLGRIDQTGAESDTVLCSSCQAQPEPVALAVAPDGSIWFSEDNPSSIAHRDAAGNVTRYVLPAPGPSPTGIAVRADGKVWVASIFGTVFLFDPAAYDALGLPHQTANASVRRSSSAIDRRALYGAARTTAPRNWRPSVGDAAAPALPDLRRVPRT